LCRMVDVARYKECRRRGGLRLSSESFDMIVGRLYRPTLGRWRLGRDCRRHCHHRRCRRRRRHHRHEMHGWLPSQNPGRKLSL
jgi:hypothetical protein